MSKIVLFRTVIGPVTPAIQSGCAPKMEKIKDAMNEDNRTSATPYCCVVSMRSNEKAIPGNTLDEEAGQIWTKEACQLESANGFQVRERALGKSHLDESNERKNEGTHFAKNINTIAGITL